MRHLDQVELQCLHDDELSARDRQIALDHLAVCAQCQKRADELRAISVAIRASLPEPETFCGEGEFWTRLAGRIAGQPVQARNVHNTSEPWLPMLPPLVFGTIGTALQLLASLTLLAFSLIGLGLLPPMGLTLTAWAEKIAQQPALGQYSDSWLGTSSKNALRGAIQQWQSLPPAIQDSVLMWVSVLTIGVLLTVVLGLFFAWTVLWSQNSRSSFEQGGHSWNTDVSSSAPGK